MSELTEPVLISARPSMNYGRLLVVIGELLVLASFFFLPWMVVDFASEQNKLGGPIPSASRAQLAQESFHNREVKIAELNRELHNVGTQVYPPELADQPGETLLKLPGAKYHSVWIFLTAATMVAVLALLPSTIAPGVALVFQVLAIIIAGVCLLYTAHLGPRFLFSGFYLGVSAYIIMVAGLVLQVRKFELGN